MTEPIALDDEAEVEFEGQVTIDYVLLNDRPPLGESLTIDDYTQPGKGSVRLLDDGITLLYTAPAGFSGEDEAVARLDRSDVG